MSEKTSSGFTLILKSHEETRLLQIFKSSSDGTGHMSLPDFLSLCFSKKFITNLTPMHVILNIFLQASGEKNYLNKDRFFFSINLLARAIFPDEIMPLELIITKILADYINEPEFTLPIFDEKLVQLLNEGVIRVFEKAEEGLLNVLMAYNSQNISNGRRTVGIQQIKAKNLGISPRNLVRYCKSRDCFPGLVNIESFSKCIEEIVPPFDKDSRKYFSYGFLVKFYEKEQKTSQITSLAPIPGEPNLRISDLQLIFGKLSILCFPTIDDPIEQISELFEGKLHLFSSPKISIKYSIDIASDSSLSDVEDPKKILQEYYHKKLVSSKNYKENSDISELVKVTPHIPTFEEISKMFDEDRVPPFPPLFQTFQENPPPYILPPIQFPLASSPNVEKKETVKKEQKNRSETPGVKVKFASMPGRFTSSTPERPRYESFAEMRKNLNGSIYPETAKQMLSNPAIQPCLIREIFMPPNAPPMVTSLIESSFVYQSNSKYQAALSTLLKAKSQWAMLEKSEFLKPDADLFFEMAKGAIFESCKKDSLALAQYFDSKHISDRLGFNNPDRALVYCGLGSVLTHLGNYHLALRSYLMAKKIRERCIGGDTIETATVYNNLGACMYHLSRFQEAFAYFELSEAIFLMMLGPQHARSLTVKQNINKVKRQNLLATPEFKVLWSKQIKDPNPKPKKKGKGKKKKSKK